MLPDHVANAIRHEVELLVRIACESATDAIAAPHVLMRPRVYLDGDRWCALYGDNQQDGVAGFGGCPLEACAAFDRAWRGEVSDG